MVWGEVSHWFTEAREHRREIERMKVQGELEAAQHASNLESIRVQADLGVKEIRVQAEADLSRRDAEGFYGAAREAMKPTGIWLVDLWNGIIRPLCTTTAVVLWWLALNGRGWVMNEWDMGLVAAILGFFFAARDMGKKGK